MNGCMFPPKAFIPRTYRPQIVDPLYYRPPEFRLFQYTPRVFEPPGFRPPENRPPQHRHLQYRPPVYKPFQHRYRPGNYHNGRSPFYVPSRRKYPYWPVNKRRSFTDKVTAAIDATLRDVRHDRLMRRMSELKNTVTTTETICSECRTGNCDRCTEGDNSTITQRSWYDVFGTMVILPVDYPTTYFTRSQADLIQECILKKLDIISEGDNAPKFTDSQVRGDCLSVTCVDRFTCRWLVRTVSDCMPWPDAKIKVVAEKEMRPIIRAIVSILGPVIRSEEIFAQLRHNNPGMQTATWSVAHTVNRDNNSHILFITMDELSWLKIENQECYLFLSSQSVQFHLFEKIAWGDYSKMSARERLGGDWWEQAMGKLMLAEGREQEPRKRLDLSTPQGLWERVTREVMQPIIGAVEMEIKNLVSPQRVWSKFRELVNIDVERVHPRPLELSTLQHSALTHSSGDTQKSSDSNSTNKQCSKQPVISGTNLQKEKTAHTSAHSKLPKGARAISGIPEVKYDIIDGVIILD